MTAENDQTLLEQFSATRSHAAFQKIVSRHNGMVYASLLRRVHNRDLAEDATQAAFLVLAKKASALASHTPLASWLLKTARYAAVDILRKESRHARHERLAGAERAEAIPSAQPHEDPRLAAIDDALLSLTTADREALLLRYHHNEPFARIAIALGTTPEAARKRVDRALLRIRSLLRRRGTLFSAALIAALMHAGADSVRAAVPVIDAFSTPRNAGRTFPIAHPIQLALLRARTRLLAAILGPGIAAMLVFLAAFFFGRQSRARDNATPRCLATIPVESNESITSITASLRHEAPPPTALSLAAPLHSSFFVAFVNLQPPHADDDDLQPQAADPVTCVILGIRSDASACQPSKEVPTVSNFQLSLSPFAQSPDAVPIQPPFLVFIAPGLPQAPTSPGEAPESVDCPRITLLAVLPLPRFLRF